MYSTCMLYRACVYRLVRSPTRSLTRCRCTRYTAARAARPSTSGMQRPANDEPRTLRAPNTEFCPQDRQSLSVSYRCGAHMTLCNGVYCTTRPSTRPAPTTPSDRRIRRIRQPPSAQRSEQQILQLDPQLLGLTHLHSVTAVRSVVPEHLANLGVPLCPFAEIDHVRASPSRKYQVLRLERHLSNPGSGRQGEGWDPNALGPCPIIAPFHLHLHVPPSTEAHAIETHAAARASPCVAGQGLASQGGPPSPCTSPLTVWRGSPPCSL
mmetsp:Transcript_29958/g.67752  ORF Transcript_29958/g.67752 Transcript_29958/m.67752 type:complete len:266 (-) Transcript_29958:324-1121(-)